MYPEYNKVKRFLDEANLLDNTDGQLKDIYELSILRNRKEVACQYYNHLGKLKGYKYSQFDKNVKILANAISVMLSEQEKNKPVVLKMKNGPHWGEAFWAIAMSGFVPLLIDARSGHSGTKNLISQSKAVAIISDDMYEYDICKISVSEILENTKVVNSNFKPSWANELILCSSGTTGDIKLMVFKGENFTSQIKASLLMCEETKDLMYPKKLGDLKILAMIPFHHIFGFVAVFLWFTYYGKTIVYPESIAPSDILKICQKVGITHVFSVPLFWDSMAQTVQRKAQMADAKKAEFLKNLIAYNTNKISKNEAGKSASSLVRNFVQKGILGNKVRYCISGGGYLSSSTAETINGIGYPLYNGYGMTEIGVTSVNLRPEVDERLKGNIGHPLNGIEYKIKISDPETKQGELFVKSPIIHLKEIIGGIEKETQFDEEGYFATGDIAMMDDNGDYYIKGRIKDVIINADGENIFPDELELYFKKLPHLSNLTIFGLKEGNSTNEKIILVIEVDTSCTDEEYEQLKKSIETVALSLPKNAKIDDVYLSKNKLPVANSMKVKRFEVRKAIQTGDPNYVSIHEKQVHKNIEGFTESEINEIREPLREIFSEILSLPKFKIEDTAHWINDLGGDSMSYVELLQKAESYFSVTIDENLYGKLATLNDFTQAILEAKKRKK